MMQPLFALQHAWQHQPRQVHCGQEVAFDPSGDRFWFNLLKRAACARNAAAGIVHKDRGRAKFSFSRREHLSNGGEIRYVGGVGCGTSTGLSDERRGLLNFIR